MVARATAHGAVNRATPECRPLSPASYCSAGCEYIRSRLQSTLGYPLPPSTAACRSEREQKQFWDDVHRMGAGGAGGARDGGGQPSDTRTHAYRRRDRSLSSTSVVYDRFGGWPVKEEVRSKLRTCGEGRTKEEGRLLPMLEDVKKEDSCGRARESGRARRG